MSVSEKTMTPRVSYTNLDIAKFICALLVIMIHTSPFVDIPVAHFYTVSVIARTAVPLFFAFSGFLLFGQMSYENSKLTDSPRNRSRLRRYLKKTINLYLFWSVVYLLVLLPEWYLIGWWGWTAVKDAVYAFLMKGMFAHLWYLLALIWAVAILYMLLRVIPLDKLRGIALVLWFAECLDTSYGWLWNNRIEFFTFVSEKLPVVFSSTRCALPLMVFGASVAVDRRSRKTSARLRKFLIVAAAWVLEASAIYFSVPGHDHFSSMFVAPFFVYVTLDLLVSEKQIGIPVRIQSLMRETIMVIYCLHPLLIHLFKKLGMVPGIVLWLLSTVASVGLAYIWALQKNRRTTNGS